MSSTARTGFVKVLTGDLRFESLPEAVVIGSPRDLSF